MKREITQIRNIDEIEKQISETVTGVLCIHLSNDKMMQMACNFVYLDKNIYTYLNSTDENYVYVKYGSAGSFTVFNNEKVTSITNNITYKLSFITVNGEIKEVDDVKLIDQITELYRLKYSPAIKAEEYKLSENLKPVILDTKEIKSVVEEGI